MKKGLLCILISFFIISSVGCSGKDKQVTLSSGENSEIELQQIGAAESIELGNNYLKQGKYDNAKKAYENAISKDKSNKQNYIDIKDKYVQNSRFDDAFYIINLAINNKVDIDNMKKILEEIKKNFQVITLENTVNQNDKFTLPEKITLSINGQEDVSGKVSWNTTNVNTSKPGTFSNSGVIEEYGRTVDEKLIVKAMKESSNTPKVTSENIYINEKLGFSITFPDSWKGKYTIEEKDNGIRVCYKPKTNIQDQGSGFLFTVLKNTPELSDHLDTVSDKMRYFKAKGVTYIIGGPTDMPFDSNHPEFQTYLKMTREKAQVVETLKGL
jgi:tetratricopeptide (TPR) repeat protein